MRHNKHKINFKQSKGNKKHTELKKTNKPSSGVISCLIVSSGTSVIVTLPMES